MRLIDHIDKGLKRRPDAPAFIHHDSVMSFREADDRARRIGHGLQQRLGTSGARVAVYSPNDPLAFCCVLGIVQAGAAWVPVNTRNPVHVNAAFLKLTECELLFFHSSLALQVAEILAVTPSIRHCVCIDTAAGPGQIALGDLADNDGSLIGTPDDPDRVVTVFPTGGTTGLSKAALWTNRVLDSAISAFWTSCPLDTPPVHLVAAPMTHGAGAVAMMMIPRGTTNVILSKADPVAIMEAIERHGVTHMYLPPTLIYMILAHPDVRRYDYGSLRYLIIAAAPIAPAKLREALDVFGPCICQSFGQAEAPMLLTYLSSHDLLEADRIGRAERFASCGRATLQVLVEIMDDAGRLLPPREKGEIVARGDLVFPGYDKNPQASADAARFGWHHTGDIGYKDEEGFVYIVDRMKDMIITGGFNVYSAEVEQAVLSHPAVQDCAVIGVPDEKWGEAVKAVVELKPGHSATEEAIIETVRRMIGPVAAPKSVEFWDELPRSPNNKVLKREIRQTFWPEGMRAVG